MNYYQIISIYFINNLIKIIKYDNYINLIQNHITTYFSI